MSTHISRTYVGPKMTIPQIDFELQNITDSLNSSYSASYGLTRSVVSSSYVPSISDTTILVNAVSNNIVISLPIASIAVNRQLNIKKIDVSTNTVKLLAQGLDKIDGQGHFVLTTPYQCVTIQCDGSSWWII